MTSDRLTPADYLAGLFQVRGLPFNVDRAEDGVRAAEDNRKARRDDAIDRFRQLGSAVWKARAAAEAAQRFYRLEPTQGMLSDSFTAQRLRSEAEEVLLDQCLGDRELYNSILHECRP
jgi:hypothetical protein